MRHRRSPHSRTNRMVFWPCVPISWSAARSVHYAVVARLVEWAAMIHQSRASDRLEKRGEASSPFCRLIAVISQVRFEVARSSWV